jgi:hypothetical protein
MAVSMVVHVPGDRRHEISNPRDDDQLEIQVLNLLVHLVKDHNGPRAGISELMGKLVLRVCRITGDDDASRPQDTEVGDDGLGGVWKTQRDAVSLANSQGGQTGCESLHQVVAFTVRDGLTEKIERRSP